MKYTIESLSKINTRFLSTHYKLIESDVDMVNNYVELIKLSRDTSMPVIGDIVRYTNEYGEYYENAHIDIIDDGMAYICEHANPYINHSENGKISFMTSGGRWEYIPIDKCTYVGTEEKNFWHFGHCGGCADGGVDFMATVNVWECNMNQQPFSTKTHNKYYVSYSKEPNEYGYRFVDGINHKAWKTREDFNAWLRTYRGVITDKNDCSLIVWAYKEREHHVSPATYDRIIGINDIAMVNGCRMCKRIYDDKHFTVRTYYVWYWNDSDMSWEEQNEFRKRYECSGLPYQYARHELASGKVDPIFK